MNRNLFLGKSWIILLALWACCSCGEGKQENIVWENRNKRIDISTLIDLKSVDMVQLETDTTCLIGRVSQLKVCDSGIFIINDYPNAEK